MSTAEPYYKADHLFLLVGENPLPNYIAAKMLLKEGGTIYLVHSTDTTSRADWLLRRLNIKNAKTVPLGNNQANSYRIRESIQSEVRKILGSYPPNQTFGFNYTGGTKAMAVHGYRAIFDAPGIQHEPVFSYLDSDTLQMLIEQNNAPPRPEPVPIKLSLEELFNLHNLPWKEDRKPNFTPVLPNAAQEFLSAYLSPTQGQSTAKQWREWCKTKLHQLKDGYGFWHEETVLEGVSGISLEGTPEPIKKILHDYKMVNPTGELSLQLASQQGFSLLSDVCAWLDAVWLEHYVLQQIKNISQNLSIQESAMSFHIDDPNNPDDRWDRFEFDVAFMRDYQLFALSCTTASDKFTCKQKLFEAHLRARQLGGDEARVALVCFSQKPEWVKRDLEATVRDNKIAVFGCKDLKPYKFTNKLTQWVRENSPQI